jgi:hypothetical protein
MSNRGNLVDKTLRKSVLRTKLNQFQILSGKKQLEEWYESGRPVPPPHIVKQITIEEYRQKYGYSTLVETGTFLGDMVAAQKRQFKEVISIELAVDLFQKAQRRFENDKNVVIVQGDSGKILPEILKNINDPVIFWLDGHYSGGITAKGDKACPVFEELDAIFDSKICHYVILIDDARCFNGEDGFPKIDELKEYIIKGKGHHQIEIKNDIIRYIY